MHIDLHIVLPNIAIRFRYYVPLFERRGRVEGNGGRKSGRACVIPLSSRLPRGLLQTVDLPSHDEIEDEACEIATRAGHRGGIDHLENCRYETNYPEHYAHPAKALAKGRGPEHGHPEGNETYRHDKEPYVEHRIEYA